jgi:hypothetical protein
MVVGAVHLSKMSLESGGSVTKLSDLFSQDFFLIFVYHNIIVCVSSTVTICSEGATRIVLFF